MYEIVKKPKTHLEILEKKIKGAWKIIAAITTTESKTQKINKRQRLEFNIRKNYTLYHTGNNYI